LATVAELLVRITADIKGFSSGVSEAGNDLSTLTSKASGASSMLAGALAAGAAIAATAIIGVGIASLKTAADMETTTTAFNVLLGSADEAQKTLTSLQKFAATTPFEFPEVAKSAKSLLAFGVSAEDLEPTLRSLGDVAAGLSIPIGELSELYGKARVQGRLFAEDVNQLTGRGIPIIAEFAKQFGVSESQVKDLVKEGKIGFPELQKAFANMSGEGGKFAGMMDAQSKTVNGLISTLKDNVNMTMASIGKDLTNAFNLQGAIQSVIDITGKVKDMVEQFGAVGAIKEFFTNMIPPGVQLAIWAVAGAITGALIPALWTLITVTLPAFAVAVWTAMAPLLPFIAIGAAVAALAYLIIKNWDAISGFFINLWDGIVEGAKSVWSAITNFFASIPGFFANLWSSIWGGITGFFSGVGKAIADFFASIPGFFTNLWNAIVTFIKNLPMMIAYGLGLIIGLYIKFWAFILTTLWNFITAIPGYIATFWAWITNAVATGVAAVIQFFSELPGKVGAFFVELWTNAVTWFTKLKDDVINGAIALYNGVIQWFKDLPGNIKTFFVNAYNNAVTAFTDLKNKVIEAARNLFQGVKEKVEAIPGFFEDMFNNIWTFLKELPGKLWDKAKEIASSFWEGFKNGLFGSPRTLVEDSFINMVTGAKNALANMNRLVPQFTTTARKLGEPFQMGRMQLATAGAYGVTAATPAAAASPVANAQNGGVVINISGLSVREEADVEKISAQLWRLQQDRLRRKGYNV
jgi:tape measure domain-containing protein